MGSTVKYRKFILPIVVGLIIWALTPIKPDALNDQAWFMFAIFVSTITYDYRCSINHWFYNHDFGWNC